jgi:hypothetical protein
MTYPPMGYIVYPPQVQTGFSSPFMNIPQQMNPTYAGQQQQYMGGPTGYNYPSQPVYGPTGVPMPHQYHPQVNRQLPFLAMLDLPDLSWLTNDPILHFLSGQQFLLSYLLTSQNLMVNLAKTLTTTL